MTKFGIVDTHLHLWDTRRLSYGWLRGNDLLNRLYLVEDYRQACADVEVAAMVFVECCVDAGFLEAEVRFVEEQAARDPRIQGIVAQARLEQGAAALPFLEQLKRSTPLLRGIRRIIERESDLDFCLRPEFIAGVRLLAPLGLSFEICVNYRHMDHLARFVELVGDVPLMLDHCGKPAVREGHLEPWRTQIRALAAHRNVMCKLSDLPVEADHRRWTEREIRPYIEAVVEAFGFERLVYGGDWPVCLQATSLLHWKQVVDRAFAGVSARDLARFYRNNAIEFYRLGLARV